MVQHTKNFALSVGILLSISHSLVMAKQYGPLTDNMGDINLNDGDIVKVDANTTSDPIVVGINSTSTTNKVTINGAATIDISAGYTKAKPSGIGINLENSNTNNLGTGTLIKAGGNPDIVGLQVGNELYDQKTRVITNNLNINIKSIDATGISVLNRNNVDLGLGGQINLNARGTAMNIDRGGTVTADGITINTGIGIRAEEGNAYRDAIHVDNKSSLDLGNNSTINITQVYGKQSNALFARGNSKVTANQLTIMAKDANGVYVTRGGEVFLGSNSYIKQASYDQRGIYASEKGYVKADKLTVETEGGYGLFASNGWINIGAGSHIITQGIGMSAVGFGMVDFKGDSVNRNRITVQVARGIGAQSSTEDAVVWLENTDIVISGGDSYGGSIGINATYEGTIIGQNISFKMLEDNGRAVVSESGGIIKLDGEINIDGALSNSQSAFRTENANSKINLTGKANIKGNISASGNGSLINLNMDAGSMLTGTSAIDTSSTANVNLAMADSTWNMTDNAKVTNLTLNNSTVNFTNRNFKTLTTESLQDNGLFNIHTDIVGQTGDLIVVNGEAKGNHQLQIANNGSTATTGAETLTVVKTGSNQANFGLANKVELGAYEYGLRASPTSANDLELYAIGKNGRGSASLTSTAQAAGSFLNIGYLTNYIENQTLLQRLGDLRNNEAMGIKTGGLWLKSFGGKLSSFSGTALDGFDMSYTGTQAGIDKALEMNNGNLVIGAMAGFTRTNPNYRHGDGNGKNYIAGLYTSYFLENGLYVDTVLKYNSMRNHFSVKDTAGTGVKGTGKTQGISLSTEIGKRFWLAEKHTGFYLEPQAQLSYGYQDGDTVHASNGLKVGLSHYNSTLGRVSGVIGYQLQGNSPVNIYLKSGLVREMSGGASYKFNDTSKQGHTFRSSWFDNGIGVNMSINKQHNIYAEFDYAKGNHFDKKQLDVGYRYNF